MTTTPITMYIGAAMYSRPARHDALHFGQPFGAGLVMPDGFYDRPMQSGDRDGHRPSLGAAGFTATWLVDDPLAPAAIPFFLLLGIGQMSCFAAAQALIGQEAPLKERGAVLGTFGLCGAAGIMLATGVGGWLFDAWMHAGPFVVVGFANAVIVLLALVVRMQSPGTMPAD